jgi:hypothetical protein
MAMEANASATAAVADANVFFDMCSMKPFSRRASIAHGTLAFVPTGLKITRHSARLGSTSGAGLRDKIRRSLEGDERGKSLMQIDERELSATYRQYSDDDIAALAAEVEKLTNLARAMLEGEIQRRGMSRAQLEKLHSRELHREARFDHLETIRRKKMLLNLLTQNDPKGTIAFVLIMLGSAAILWLWSLRH